MTGEKNKYLAWIPKAEAALASALLFGAALFLGVPALLGNVTPIELTGVDPLGWKPQSLLELCPADSLPSVLRRGGASLYLRYDASAPATFAMVMNSVIKDGSERRDTVQVSLADAYGRPAGNHGHVMSETTVPLTINVKAGECRLVELYPAAMVRGIHAVGVMPE